MMGHGAQHLGQFINTGAAAAEFTWNGCLDKAGSFKCCIIVSDKAVGFIGNLGSCGEVFSQRFGAGYEVE